MYLVRGLFEDWIIVVDVHYPQVDGELNKPRWAAVIRSSHSEVQPLDLLKVHSPVGHNLTCRNNTTVTGGGGLKRAHSMNVAVLLYGEKMGPP